jgi:DME family drug/metabolite transporter
MRHTIPVPAVLLVILSCLLFGTTGTTQTFAPADATPLSIGSARMVLGGALMGLVGLANWRRRVSSGVTPPPPAAVVAPRWPIPSWLALGLAGLGMALYQVTFFAGTRANGVAVGTVVAIGTAPLFTGAFEWLVRRHRPGRPWLIATGLGVIGVVLLSAGGEATLHPAGLAYSLAAGAAYALEMVLLKIPLDRGWTSSDAVSWVMVVAAAACLPVLVTTDVAWIATGRGAAVLGWLAVVTIVCAYQLLAKGLAGLPAATATTLTLTEPATATVLGVIVVGERLAATGVAGLVAIAAGLLLLARSARL